MTSQSLPETCPSCQGTGRVLQPVNLSGTSDSAERMLDLMDAPKCPTCGGCGRVVWRCEPAEPTA